MKFMPGPLTTAVLILYVLALQPLMVQALLLLFHVAVQPVVASVFVVVGDQPRFVRALGHVVPPEAALTVTVGAAGLVMAVTVESRPSAVVT
jgi:hypothetical protein